MYKLIYVASWLVGLRRKKSDEFYLAFTICKTVANLCQNVSENTIHFKTADIQQ